MKNIEEERAKANKGDIESQFYMGRYYGDERFRDDVKSFYWLKLAADQGHQMAQSFVGFSYEVGEGVIKSTKLSLTYYKMAALQIFFSGYIEYGQGKGKPTNSDLNDNYKKTTNSNVANVSYLAALKYIKSYTLPKEISSKEVEYLYFKELFDKAIISF